MEDLELINGEYHYKGIFTVVYEEDVENECINGELLLTTAKNTIDALLNNTLFDHIMNSRFGDFNIILDVLENIDDDKHNESFRVTTSEPNDLLDCIHVGELVIKYILGRHYNHMKFTLQDKTFMYRECDECRLFADCENEDCDYIVRHKLIPMMTKSARN